MANSTDLTSAIQSFYDVYHQKRVREASVWMRTVYWPAFAGRVLELGGGTLFPERDDYFLADLSPEAARRANAKGIPALVADGAELPFASASFDTLACYDVLEHVLDPRLFLAEMGRVARQRIVIAGPNYIGSHLGGVSRYLPLRLWEFASGKGRGFARLENPHLTFDENWAPDRDAVAAPNAGWVAEQLQKAGFRTRHLRTWEYNHHWLNRIPGVRCLGPFMFVVGEKA